MEQNGPYYDALRGNPGYDLRSLLATERDRTMQFRDQLDEERGKSDALKIAMDNMTKAYEKACRDIDDLKVENRNLLDRICKVQDNHIFAYVELFSATGQSSHRDALNWIKMAASVVPGCVDSTKEKIAALSENEELKRKVAELKVEVDNQQEELLDCKAVVNFTQDSRDYWRGACSKLTKAIGKDAIKDAVEWINVAKIIEKRVFELKDVVNVLRTKGGRV